MKTKTGNASEKTPGLRKILDALYFRSISRLARKGRLEEVYRKSVKPAQTYRYETAQFILCICCALGIGTKKDKNAAEYWLECMEKTEISTGRLLYCRNIIGKNE